MDDAAIFAAKIQLLFLSVTDSYRILPIFTAFYRNLPILTASYRFLPIFTDSGVLLRSMGEEGTAKNRQGSCVAWEARQLEVPTQLLMNGGEEGLAV